MKILIIRYSAVGDIILTTGPIKILKDEYPELEIHFLTSESGAEILNGFVFIDKVHVLEQKLSAWKFLKKIKSLGIYDHIIDLQAKPKTSLLRFFNKSPFYQIRNQSYKRRLFVLKRKYKTELTQHVVEKYYEVLKSIFNLPEKSKEELRPFLFSKKIISEKQSSIKKIAIHPYASQKNKVWPYVNELIHKIEAQGFQCVILGETNEPFDVKDTQNTLNLTNKTSLKEMASIIASCQALISTDSGPMHLGVALNKPTLALFGPTTKEFGFYPDFKNTLVIEENLDCRPCHVHGGNHCPLEHHHCMKNITVDRVLQNLRLLL